MVYVPVEPAVTGFLMLLRLTVSAVVALAPPAVVIVTIWPLTDAVTAPARKPELAVTAVAPPESRANPAGNVTFTLPPAGIALTVVNAATAVPTLPGTRLAGVTLVDVSVPTAAAIVFAGAVP
jgi:hypothetical protein